MKTTLLKVCFIISINWSSCTITGISYLDDIIKKNSPSGNARGDDPCNSLYWYPQNIPDYCLNFTTNTQSKPPQEPRPVPIPVPMPIPPMPMPMPMPMAPVPMAPMPMAMPPVPMSIPYGLPLAPSNPIVPISSISYNFPPYSIPQYSQPMPPFGMVPGLPGIVSPDGGINVLPFSDIYSDLIEKYKFHMARKSMERMLKNFEGSRKSSRRKYYD